MKWTLYKSTKRFLTFPGLFSKQGAPAGWVTSRERAEERCLELGNDCVALETRRDSSVVTMLDYIDLDSFRPSPSVRTRIRAVRIDRQTRILATSAWDLSDIDFCCPENRRIEQDTVRQSLRDNIKRISCDIPAEEFEADYVRRQEPVILENCTSLWEAQHSWTFSSLLGLGGGKETWRTDFITNQEMMQLWGQKGEAQTQLLASNFLSEFLSGETVANIIRDNGTVRVFEVLGRKAAQERVRRGEVTRGLKERMMEDYEKPGPIPQGETVCRVGLLFTVLFRPVHQVRCPD